MSTSPLSASSDVAEVLSTLDALSLSFNVYPLISKTIEDRRSHITYRSLLSLCIALIVVHLILLIQATITLGLKLSYRAKTGKIWFWRKHYLLDQTVPYLVPNGHFIVEPLQIIGCIFFELCGAVIYILIRHPEIIEALPGLLASCFFWLAVSYIPGFVGFWWNGWSSFYVLFLTPTHTTESSRKYTRLYYRPIFMNTVCIGVPVLISCFLVGIGVALAVEQSRCGKIYNLLTINLRQLAERWKPNDPKTFDNNQHLVDSLKSLLAAVTSILTLLQLMAIGWAITAVIIIIFYIGTVISVGRVIQRTMTMATGKATLLTFDSKDMLTSQTDASGRRDDFNSQAGNNYFQSTLPLHQVGITKSASSQSIERKQYFLRASCGLIVISLGFNCFTSSVFAHKVRSLLVHETHWQLTLSSLVTGSCLLLSISLFIQSLMHIQHYPGRSSFSA